jgi:probable rRNA maturation factor
MKSFNVNLDIEDTRWIENTLYLNETVDRTIDALMPEVVDKCPILAHPIDFYVNLCLSDDENVRRLNGQFRGIDAPTNVLSFANIDQEGFVESLDETDQTELGDIIIAFETMQRQADELDISLHDHFCHLWVHGLLHLLGYDHQTPEDAAVMEKIEAAALARLEIENPYRDEA